MMMRPAIPRGAVRLSLAQVAATARGLLEGGEAAAAAVARFERELAALVGSRRAIATSSGKAALVAILRALGARAGDGVILSSYNVPEVVSVLAGLGLRPRFVDIDRGTFNLDTRQVEAAIDDRTRFVLATHLYGNPIDLEPLLEVCSRRGLDLIEDCAQALGARYRGAPVGTFGRAALFSFGMMKSLNTLSGGMAVTNDPVLADAIAGQVAAAPVESNASVARQLAVAGALNLATRRGAFAVAGYPVLRLSQRIDSSVVYRLVKMRAEALESGHVAPETVLGRMGAAQARCGLAGLGGVESAAAVRRRHATRLAGLLAGQTADIAWQSAAPGAEPVWTQFVVRVVDRLAVKRRLLGDGIDTTMGYLQACHRMPGTGAPAEGFPCSDELEQHNLYLPISEELSDTDITWIAERLLRAVRA